MARRAPLHPRRAAYGRHWRDFSEECFVVGEALQLYFPCKTFAIGGRRTIAKGAFVAQGGGHGPVSPLSTSLPARTGR